MATINIIVHNAKPLWSPGDTIIGEVQFRSPATQADVQAISVTLKGKSKTRYTRSNGNNSSTTYRSKVTIFRLMQVLFQGPFTLAPGYASWPFEFIIPVDCRWSEGDKFGQPGQFDSSNAQPPPPTFKAGGGHRSFEVSYALEAVMNTSTTFSRPKEFLYPLIIAPKRTSEATDYHRFVASASFSVRTLHLDPEINNRSLSFKETMRTAFKSDTLPSSTFNVKLELPEAAVLYDAVKPVIYLEHDLQRSTATSLPVVHLVSFQLSLKYDTFIRMSSAWKGHIDQDFSDGIQIGSWAGKVPLGERFEPSKLFRDGLMLRGMPPTFRTFNVAFLYRWKVKYTLECATKRMNGECSRGCLILGPERAIATTGSSVPQIESSLSPPPINAEEQLPAYSKCGESGKT